MKVGDPLGGLVVPHSASKPYVINDPRYAKLSKAKQCDNIDVTAATPAKSPQGGMLKQFGRGRNPLTSVLQADHWGTSLNSSDSIFLDTETSMSNDSSDRL